MEEYNYSIYVIGALCGNSWVESTINPGINERGSGSGFGLFQWTGDRRTALENWLTANGYVITDPNGQMRYLVIENDWIDNTGHYSNLTDFLNSTSTYITELTTDFCLCWERPANPDIQTRVERANQCIQYIMEHASDENISEWVIADRYLTESESLNNAVLLYRFYSGGGIIIRTRKMPLWMMLRYNL